MPLVTFVTPDGVSTAVDARLGDSLMIAAITHSIDGIEGECGSSLACGTCHVYVESTELPLPDMCEGEDALLDITDFDRRENSRLGCRIILTEALDGMVVSIPGK